MPQTPQMPQKRQLGDCNGRHEFRASPPDDRPKAVSNKAFFSRAASKVGGVRWGDFRRPSEGLSAEIFPTNPAQLYLVLTLILVLRL